MEALEDRTLLAVLYWDTNGSTAGLGGGGTWDLSAANWNPNSDGTGATQAWTNGNDAVFAGTAGTVSISGQVSANSLTFSTDSYTLQSGNLSLPGSTTVNVSTGASTISSTIVGTGSLVKSGAGTLIVSASNTFSGSTTIQEGTLQLGANNSLPTGGAITFGTSTTNGSLELNGFNQQVAGLAVAAGATAGSQVIGNSSTIADSTLTYYATSGTSTFGGTIQDRITGAGTHTTAVTIARGTLSFTGDNTYSGGTAVNTSLTASSQWASSVINRSSQYSSSGWSAAQATGAPNVTAYGDDSRAWAPSSKNGTTEYITLGYTTAVYANGVTIRETCGNGFVTKVEVRNAASGTLETVWTGTDSSTPNTLADFSIPFDQRTYLVDAVRVTIDTNRNVSAWEEIDAVQLRGNVGGVGELVAGNEDALGTGVVTLNGGTLQAACELSNAVVAAAGANSSVAVTAAGTVLTLAGDISGSGTIRYQGASGQRLELSGDNSGFSGTFTQTGAASTTHFTAETAGSDQATWNVSEGVLANAVTGSASIDLGAISGNGTLRNDAASGSVSYAVGSLNQSTTFGGTIVDGTGSVTLAKQGTGTLTLSGANTNSGGTTIAAGVLQVGAGGVSGAIGSGAVVNNASLVFNSTGSVSVAGAISGTGSVTQQGTGTLLFSNSSNSYTGGTTIAAGALAFADGALGTSGNIAITGSATLRWSTGNTQDISGRLALNNNVTATLDTNGNNVTLATGFGGAGSGAVTKTGSGTLTFAAANTYTGVTTCAGGTLYLAIANACPGNAVINGGTLAFVEGGVAASGTITVSGTSTLQWANGNTQDISGRLVLSSGSRATFDTLSNNVTLATAFGSSGSAAIAKSGTGTLALSASNTYTGGTTISGGTVVFAYGGLGSSGTITFAGNSTLCWASGNARDISSRLVINNGVNATLDIGTSDVTLATSFGGSGSGAVTKNGTGTLYLTTANTYTGGTTINAGTVEFRTGALGTSGAITFAGNSTLRWYQYFTSGNTDDISSRLVIGNGVTATLDTKGNNITFATGFGANGSGAITKLGDGTLTLAAANTYTGTTLVTAGTLALTAANACMGGATLNGGTVSFASGGFGASAPIVFAANSTLRWADGNTDDVSNRLALSNAVAATLDIGANNVTFASSFGGTSSGAIAKNGTGTLTLGAANTYTGGTTSNAGTVAFADGGLGTIGAIHTYGGSTLRWTAGNTQDISSRFTGINATLDVGGNTVTFASSSYSSGTLTKAGSGTLITTATLSTQETFTIAAGVVQIGDGGMTGAIAATNVVNNAALVVNSANNVAIEKVISGTGSVTKTGVGTLYLTAANTYTGGTTIADGTLEFRSGTLGPSGTIAISGDATLRWYQYFTSGNTEDISGRLVINTGVTATLDTKGNNVTFASGLSSNTAADMVKLGSGVLSIVGDTTFTGSASVEEGTLAFADSLTLTSGGSIAVTGEGSVDCHDGLTLTSTGTLTADDEAVLYFTGSQSISGNGTVQLCSTTAAICARGVDSSTAATLTIGAQMTVVGPGVIEAYYTGDGVTNLGTIRADDSALVITAPLSNQGTVLAMGSGSVTVEGRYFHGSASSISGTELFLFWTGIDDDAASYSLEVSADGGTTYTSTASLSATDKTFLQDLLDRNTSYHLRMVATNAQGGHEIYDSDPISTLDLPDVSGWYHIDFEGTGPDYNPEFWEVYPEYSRMPVFAGSPRGAVLRTLPGLVTDGTVPTVDESGHMVLYVYAEGYGSSLSALGSNLMADSGNDAVFAMAAADAPTPVSTYGGTRPEGTVSVPYPYAADVSGENGSSDSASSEDPIRYFDGTVDYSTTDLSSDGLGETFTQSRSWTSYSRWSVGQRQGSGWIDDSLPTLQQANNGETLSVMLSAIDTVTFELSGGQYVPTSYVADTLVHDTTNHEFVYADNEGNEIRFGDFSTSTPTGRQGGFKSKTDAGGLLTYVAAWTADGAVHEVRRQNTASQDVESWYYSYLPSTSTNAGLLSSVQFRQSNGSGDWTLVRQVAYQYYEGTYSGSDRYGNLGDLKMASVRDASGTILNTDYYRYYTPGEAGGYVHGLKYIFDAESYARLIGAVGNPTLVTDAAVAGYALQYFEYDAFRRCTRHDIQQVGGTATDGIGTFTYQYYTANMYSADTNDWQYKTIETLPDGNQNIIYCNAQGALVLKDFWDIEDSANPALSDQHWLTYCRYDTDGRLLEEAQPSAVTDYEIDANNDLVVTVADYSGLINVTEYYTSTTATEAAAGGVKGFLYRTKVKQGELGTAVVQEAMTYYKRTSGGRTNVVPAAETEYRNTDGTGAETTSYSYTWYSGTAAVESATISLPVVTAAQNGPATADTTIVVCDLYGRPVWTKDADGYLTYTAYDALTGAAIKTITDVDTQQTGDFTGLPTGWTTPTGAGLHLVTTCEVDAFGRTTKLVDPNGNVTYAVYNDVNREVRTYAGWNATTSTPAVAVAVYREDRSGNYTETLSFVWNDASGLPVDGQGRPSGAESLTDARAVIKSLSRSLLNSAGQLVQTREYYDLTGVSYSTARNLGTEGVNYRETETVYGPWGDTVKVIDPSGTIRKTLFDSQGRPTTILVGTNDTAGSSNMVAIQENVYDNNGVGDGNLTQATLHPGSGLTDRVTQYAYDWRGRLIATKEGVQATEDTATNRPITYLVLDNLGQIVDQRIYDGDDVSLASLGSTNGVPNAPSSSLLRAQTLLAYDEQGRLYRVTESNIDQSLGTVLSSRATNYWYDHRGDLIKVRSPNGSVSKYQYDGAGRLAVEATTNGAGDTTWLDATNLDGDLVVERADYTYDDAGNCTAVTDLLDQTTAYAYDALNRVTSQTDANNDTTLYAYDAAGNLYSLTDAEGNATTWTYDLLGRAVAETTAFGTTYAEYDALGNVLRTTDRNGRVIEYTYDYLGRRTAEDWLDSQEQTIYTCTYTYNLLGDLLTASDPAASYTYVYNVLGQLTQVNQQIDGLSADVVMVQEFDAAGNRTRLQGGIDLPDFVTDYAYDGYGQVTSIVQYGLSFGSTVAQKRVDFTYDADGRWDTITRYFDAAATQLVATSTYGYDVAGQLTTLAHTKGATTLAGYTWDYDDAGRLTQQVSTIDGTVAYTYDATGQLTDADYDGLTPDEDYTYDDNGNRTNTGYTTGAYNRLTCDGTYTYEYDAEGNRTLRYVWTDADTDGVVDTGEQSQITEYTWDYRNRLVCVTARATEGGPATQVVNYAYDTFNRLVGRTMDADGDAQIDQREAFAYDGNQIVLHFQGEGTADLAAADLAHRYLWGNAVDQLLADEQVHYDDQLDDYVTDDILWPLADQVGTARDLAEYDSLNDATSIANHRVYDSFGNLQSETDAAIDCLFGYTARPFDEATGLQNNRNRWFDPVGGRWASEDPIGFAAGDVNLYGYVQNQPVIYADPSGLLTVHVWPAADGRWGHASVTLDNGTYISWWPQQDNRDYGFLNWGSLVNSYSVDPIRDRQFYADVRDEGNSQPKDTRIEGLNEDAIQKWWDTFSSDPSSKWSTATQNCSTTVADALKAGGATVGWWDLKAGHNFIWRPEDVQRFADAINRYLESTENKDTFGQHELGRYEGGSDGNGGPDTPCGGSQGD
jgi:RHS repeat-associated protein